MNRQRSIETRERIYVVGYAKPMGPSGLMACSRIYRTRELAVAAAAAFRSEGALDVRIDGRRTI